MSRFERFLDAVCWAVGWAIFFGLCFACLLYGEPG